MAPDVDIDLLREPDEDGNTLLHHLPQMRNEKDAATRMLSLLLGFKDDKGALIKDVNAQNKAGETRLHLSETKFDTHMLMRELGASPSVTDRQGLTPAARMRERIESAWQRYHDEELAAVRIHVRKRGKQFECRPADLVSKDRQKAAKALHKLREELNDKVEAEQHLLFAPGGKGAASAVAHAYAAAGVASPADLPPGGGEPSSSTPATILFRHLARYCEPWTADVGGQLTLPELLKSPDLNRDGELLLREGALTLEWHHDMAETGRPTTDVVHFLPKDVHALALLGTATSGAREHGAPSASSDGDVALPATALEVCTYEPLGRHAVVTLNSERAEEEDVRKQRDACVAMLPAAVARREAFLSSGTKRPRSPSGA